MTAQGFTRCAYSAPGKPDSSRVSTDIIKSAGLSGPWSEGEPTWQNRNSPQTTSPPISAQPYTWIAEKAMPAYTSGRLWKFQTSEIDDWARRGGAAVGSEPSPPR